MRVFITIGNIVKGNRNFRRVTLIAKVRYITVTRKVWYIIITRADITTRDTIMGVRNATRGIMDEG